MKNRYVLKTFLTFFLSFFVVFGGFCASSYIQKKKMHDETSTNILTSPVKNLFMKKSQLPKDYRHHIRVEMMIKQHNEKDDGRIEAVFFDGKPLPLSSEESSVSTGSIFVRVPPGTHEIIWKVTNPRYIWPTSTTFTRTLVISEDQLWIYVTIDGDNIDIR